MDVLEWLKSEYNIYLNEEQSQALMDNGNRLICAPPGSGKSHLAMAICGSLIKFYKVNPQQILALTFSRDAANHMKNRFEKLFGFDLARMMKFSTIHSFCFTIIKANTKNTDTQLPILIEEVANSDGPSENKGKKDGSSVPDKGELPTTKNKLLRAIYTKCNGDYANDEDLETLSNWVSYIKNKNIDLDFFDARKIPIKNFKNIYCLYEQEKTENNWMDFDDMVVYAYRILKSNKALSEYYRNRYKYILVDEAQDCSTIQFDVIHRIAFNNSVISYIGDCDQSIYSFRAASPEYLLNFKKAYPDGNIYYLKKNYRSTANIVNAATKFIRINKNRFDLTMTTDNGPGEPIRHTCCREIYEQYPHIAESIRNSGKKYSDFAVLYKNNVSAIPVADMFDRYGIPFYIRDFKPHFFSNWVTLDILAFFKLAADGHDIQSYRRIYNKMNSYFTKDMNYYIKCRIDELTSEDNHDEIKKLSHVLDIALDNPNMEKTFSGNVMRLKGSFDTLKNYRPHEGIEYIDLALGYGEFLRRKTNGNASEFEGSLMTLNCLKSLASFCSTTSEFISRLDSLKTIMRKARMNKGMDVVTLQTIHSSKGLEYGRVFLVDLVDGMLPNSKSIEESKKGIMNEIEEEARVYYVGVTRAKRYLELLSASSCHGNFVTPSRFVQKLMKEAET